jgi:hypothetical protein
MLPECSCNTVALSLPAVSNIGISSYLLAVVNGQIALLQNDDDGTTDVDTGVVCTCRLTRTTERTFLNKLKM